jgi:hypothetical protein
MPVPQEVSDLGPEAVDTYARALPYGERWALMVATQTPPGTRGTDRAFMEGRLNDQWLDDMPKRQAERMLREARAAGINPHGKTYVGGLADQRAHRDPEAWVDSTADVLRVARKRNLTVEGIVSHKGTQVPKEAPALSEQVLKKDVAYYRKLHPGKSTAELREMAISKHALKRKK